MLFRAAAGIIGGEAAENGARDNRKEVRRRSGRRSRKTKEMKALALALAVCLLMGMPLSAPAEDASFPTAQAAEGRDPASLGLKENVYSGGEMLDGYRRDISITAPGEGGYIYMEDTGVYAFRGDNLRRNAAFGTCEAVDGEFVQLWRFDLGGLRTEESGTLYGVGWNSQPAVVKWAKEIRQAMPLYDEYRSTVALREVIFGAHDGKVYFLDLVSGNATRDPIDIGYPLRGSVSVYPTGLPVIAFGQAVSKMPAGTGEIGFFLYDLVNMKPMLFINGRRSADQVQYSANGAFDSSALFTREPDALVVAGENGLLYTTELYPAVKINSGEVSVSFAPRTVYMNSLAADERENRTAVEGAVSMWGKYVFLGDAWGIVRCVDTDTMRTVWTYDNGDNTDAAMALDPTDGGVALYTGNTTYARLSKTKKVSIHRLNALTGEEIWTYEIDCVKNTSLDAAGCKASPVVGEKGLSDYVYFTVNQVRKGGAVLLCLRKDDGSEVWRKEMAESVSSPVAIYTEFGDGKIIQCDSKGNIYLLDGLTGDVLGRAAVNGTIEASPVVYRDFFLIGTSDKNAAMYCFRIQ